MTDKEVNFIDTSISRKRVIDVLEKINSNSNRKEYSNSEINTRNHKNSWEKVEDFIGIYKGEYKNKETRRKSFANVFLWTLIAQLILVNTIIILVGLDILKFQDRVIIVFITSTFVELVGLISYIIFYFFKDDKSILNIVEKVLKYINKID